MWPSSFGPWARRARGLVARQVINVYAVLYGTTELSADAREGVDQAVSHALGLAWSHCDHAGYFTSEREFRQWLIRVALREAVRLLLRQEDAAFQQLTAEQRRSLGMVYVDQLPPRDAADVLGVTLEELLDRNQAALAALARLLQRAGGP